VLGDLITQGEARRQHPVLPVVNINQHRPDHDHVVQRD